MAVVCPKCGGEGAVRLDRGRGVAAFQCGACHWKRETVPGDNRAFEGTAQCTSTGKYFRTALPAGKVRGRKARLKCPYCDEFVMGDVSPAGRPAYPVYQDIRNGEDPYFHYPLYFQASYRGKTVWALNREHLRYLIDYLSADVRTVPYDFYEANKTMRAQSDQLPAFMKAAKNREGIVKLLRKLRDR